MFCQDLLHLFLVCKYVQSDTIILRIWYKEVVPMFFAGKRGFYYSEKVTERSSSSSWSMISGPEPSHMTVWLSSLAKLARQWLTLIWDLSTFTNLQILFWLDKRLISKKKMHEWWSIKRVVLDRRNQLGTIRVNDDWQLTILEG
jgi:hypothetical protein